MTKFRLFNYKCFLRAVLAASLSVGLCMLAGVFLREMLDLISQTSYSSFWRELFYMLSAYQIPIGVAVCFMGVALCAGWILAPAFDNLADVVSASLNREGQMPPVQLPKQLRRLEDALESTNRELLLWRYAVREAEQRKDDLVVYLAHDIRTPLTSVLGYLTLLEDSPDLPGEQRRRYIGIAHRKARRMETLVEELFEVTRFNVGQIELEKTEVSADTLVRQLCEELSPQLEERSIVLGVENQGLDRIFVDPDKMARALENILQNALRYTPAEGRIRVELGRAGPHARIAVSNTGSDISPQRLARFFEKFYRGDEARQSGTGGSGLGLAIAKNIIEAHGGSISAVNKDRVTTFTILL